jgi:uncharacterized protein (DUF2141 family)
VKIAVFAIALTVAACSSAPEPKAASPTPSLHGVGGGVLRVNVHGVTPGRGRVVVAVYDNADAFPKSQHALRVAKAYAASDPTMVTIESLAPGPYACAVFDDVDGNDVLNTNFVGYPSEPFGFSNDARVKLFGPPGFDDAKFEFRAPETNIDITLH